MPGYAVCADKVPCLSYGWIVVSVEGWPDEDQERKKGYSYRNFVTRFHTAYYGLFIGYFASVYKNAVDRVYTAIV